MRFFADLMFLASRWEITSHRPMSTSAEALPGLDMTLTKIETVEGQMYQYHEVTVASDRRKLPCVMITP